MSEQFKNFLTQLSETNATLDYFVDFEKIIGNINKIYFISGKLGFDYPPYSL